MILSGKRIEELVKNETILVKPFNQNQVNPTSLSVTLGDQVSLYEDTFTVLPAAFRARGMGGLDSTEIFPPQDFQQEEVDSRKALRVNTWTIPEEGWVLKPGLSYLMHTEERIWSDEFVPIFEGKSVASPLLKVRATGEVNGFNLNSQFPLEVTSSFPVRVYAGMKIGEVRFHRLEKS